MQPIIIGGGWSGLAATVRLAEAGQKPILFEAAKQLGGRARSVTWQDIVIDNGQHLMIGAYQNMLDLLHRIGIDENSVFQRKAFDLQILDPQFPPLHLSAHPLLPWQIAILPKLYSSIGWQELWRFLRIARQLKSSIFYTKYYCRAVVPTNWPIPTTCHAIMGSIMSGDFKHAYRTGIGQCFRCNP